MLDIWIVLIFGVIGYLMRKFGFPVAPMVLAAVLAKMLETSLMQSLVIARGSALIFFTRPISLAFMLVALFFIARGIWLQIRTPAANVALEESV
jgi:putative tricarboxylic transport membrane protein